MNIHKESIITISVILLILGIIIFKQKDKVSENKRMAIPFTIVDQQYCTTSLSFRKIINSRHINQCGILVKGIVEGEEVSALIFTQPVIDQGFDENGYYKTKMGYTPGSVITLDANFFFITEKPKPKYVEYAVILQINNFRINNNPNYGSISDGDIFLPLK